jgi:hypothetical protein
MNGLEVFLLEIGFSFTLAKAFPHIFFFFLGGGLAFIFVRHNTLVGKMKWVFGFVLLVSLEALYFSLSPWYYGDIFEVGVREKTTLALPKDRRLLVVADPDCHSCIASTENVKIWSPFVTIPIQYMLLSKDSSDVEFFNRLLPSNVSCSLSPDSRKTLHLVKGYFPSYVLIDKGQVQQVWNNNVFGARALDIINTKK